MADQIIVVQPPTAKGSLLGQHRVTPLSKKEIRFNRWWETNKNKPGMNFQIAQKTYMAGYKEGFDNGSFNESLKYVGRKKR